MRRKISFKSSKSKALSGPLDAKTLT